MLNKTRDLLKPIYLDHNATTPMEQSALDALLFFSSTCSSSEATFGNPSSIHGFGRKTKNAVDKAREQVAQALGIENPEEICFVSSATEAINMALKGAFFHEKNRGKSFHLILSRVEHEANLETAKFLESQGATLHFLEVNERGEISLSALEELLRELSQNSDRFLMLSLMAANNETGVIFPYKEAGELAKQYGALFHLDAVQAPGKIVGFSLRGFAVDLASFSAHKIGGPKGVGALYVKRGIKLSSLLHGGAQERKRRAGTLNVPGIVALGAAAEILNKRDILAVTSLRDRLEKLVCERIPGVEINGAGAMRISNTSNFLFNEVRGESLLMALDLAGFAVSSGSACNSGSIGPSHVLMAMGKDKVAAASAIRVSLGPSSTESEILCFVEALAPVIERIRNQAKKTPHQRG